MKKYKLNNLDCASCASKIENSLSKLEEVKFVAVNFANSTMTIDTDNLDKVKAQIKKLEPEVVVEDLNAENTTISQSELVENKETIIKAILGICLLIIGMVFENQIHTTPFHIGEDLVFGIGYLIVGWAVISSALLMSAPWYSTWMARWPAAWRTAAMGPSVSPKPLRTMLAPWAAKAWAIPKPMPLVEPVTKAVFPVSMMTLPLFDSSRMNYDEAFIIKCPVACFLP